MRTLATVLEAAISRAASEVLLESGQPVVYTTSRGSEAESSVLPGSELFDMIASAVDDSQQIELAVGNPVEFKIEAGASWSVVAEPGIDGMRVRAEREVGAADLDAAFALDVPGFESGSGGGPTRGGSASPGAIDFEPYDANGGERGAPVPGPAAPFESGTWALEDDDDFEVSLRRTGEHTADHFNTGDSAASMDSESVGLDLGVPDDDDDDDDDDELYDAAQERGARAPAELELGDNLPRVGNLSSGGAAPVPEADAAKAAPEPTFAPPVPAKTPAKSGVVPAAPVVPVVPAVSLRPNLAPTMRDMNAQGIPQRVTRRDTPVAGSSSLALTQRELPAMGGGKSGSKGGGAEAETRRELPSFGRGEIELNEIAADIDEGALVYITELGFGELLAQSFHAPTVLVDDRVETDEAWARLRSMPIGAIVVVTREDPSQILGWILRRLEEGYRVFLETRARSAEGARRVLLGMDASERAESWLRAQTELVVEPGENGPKVRAA